MSIRIQNDQAADVASTSASRAEQAGRAAGGAAKSGNSVFGGGEDSVEVSSVTSSIGDALSTHIAAHASRIERLSALYANGQYTADSMKTSQALVSGAVGASGSALL
jgi:anti-sigma28 factor (negative regulator of flagellin synthesis)